MGLLVEQVASKLGNCDVDLESGEAVLDSKVNHEPETGDLCETRQLLSNGCYGLGSCDGSMQCEARVSLSIASNHSDASLENVKLIVDKKAVVIAEKNTLVKEKPKAMSAKKPPKPPRPPRGLSLDSADQKLIRELAEIAKLKRARIERMKALKKMKEAKTSSSKNQLFATLFTILFCLVILFQGISSRTNSATIFQGSPMISGGTEGGMISLVHIQNLSANDAHRPGSESSSLVEQVPVPDTQKKAGTAVG